MSTTWTFDSVVFINFQMYQVTAKIQLFFSSTVNSFPYSIDTFHKQVAGGAHSSCFIGGSAGKPATVFSKCLTNNQPGKSVLVADLEVNGALDLVVLPEPDYDRGRVTADFALQGH